MDRCNAWKYFKSGLLSPVLLSTKWVRNLRYAVTASAWSCTNSELRCSKYRSYWTLLRSKKTSVSQYNITHSVVEFRFKFDFILRGKNVRLILLKHYSFSEPNRIGFNEHFETYDKEFEFYNSTEHGACEKSYLLLSKFV